MSSNDSGVQPSRPNGSTSSGKLRPPQWLNDLRAHVESKTRLNRLLFTAVVIVILLDTLMILYALSSLVARMSFAGVGLVDSLPLSLYILPLLVILVSVLRGYVGTRVALGALVILGISGVVFGVLSNLVRGFVVLSFLNLFAVLLMPLLGPVLPPVRPKNMGRKGLVWLVVLNLLGAMFPVSVYVMGQVPVGSVDASPAQVYVDIPMSPELVPQAASVLSNLSAHSLGADLRVSVDNNESWSRLEVWLTMLDSFDDIPILITLSLNRSVLIQSPMTTLGSTGLFDSMYGSYSDAIEQLTYVLEDAGISAAATTVMFDMRLSEPEWAALMGRMRSIDLAGVTSLYRHTLDLVSRSTVESLGLGLIASVHGAGLEVGFLIESFAFDDWLDNDTKVMLACGVTAFALNEADRIEVDCSRSRFSREMNGDVGEYLAYSYGLSAGAMNGARLVGLRLGRLYDESGPMGSVLTPAMLQRDITVASGTGVSAITVESITELMSHGGNWPEALLGPGSEAEPVGVRYTFRIYAFRAVTMAIDSFDALTW